MIDSFKNALRGISDALNSEVNLKIHFSISILVILLAIILKFSSLEFAILILTIFIVIILELINTTIEKLSDVIHPEIFEKIRIIKDISAGTVLLGAIASIIVAFFLFLPKLV